MRHMKSVLMIVFASIVGISCSENDDPTNQNQTGPDPVWSIPVGNVLDGGPGKDGIPSVDRPKFISVSEAASVMEDGDLVVGFKNGDDVRAYPHDILDWHEIVNDEVGNKQFALNYCPLTGTAMAWNRVLNGETTTFGVSGLLFNTNLMPYDRETNSTWSQMLTSSVNGELRESSAELFQVIEMPWSEWKKIYPNSKVLSRDTGISRSYGRYPYGSYRETNQLLFPVEAQDDRLFGKERVLGVIVENQAKIYRFEEFEEGLGLIKDNFLGEDVIVVGNPQFMVAFGASILLDASDATRTSQPGELQLVVDRFPIVLKDELGNEYNVFGEIINGPDEGMRLKVLESYMGFYFSFPAFFGLPEIYGFEG